MSGHSLRVAYLQRVHDNEWTVVGTLIAVIIISAVFWTFAPKENQTVWRSSVILTLAMCYLMWAITYLCQLHPLIQPKRSDLRPETTASS